MCCGHVNPSISAAKPRRCGDKDARTLKALLLARSARDLADNYYDPEAGLARCATLASWALFDDGAGSVIAVRPSWSGHRWLWGKAVRDIGRRRLFAGM